MPLARHCGLIVLLLVFVLSVDASQWSKRAPPFAGTEEIPPHLGDYTHSHESIEAPTYTCEFTGICTECTDLEKKTLAYCMEYGNKRPVRCQWTDPHLTEEQKHQPKLYDDDEISLPSFQACPRVASVERWKFIKFETINFIVAVLSLVLVLWRQRKLARDQHQRLVQRIGIPSVAR